MESRKVTREVVMALFAFFCLQLQTCLAFPGGQADLANAAVKYLRADAALRQSYTIAPDGAVKLEAALEAPLDDEDQKIAAAADEALIEFHHAAALKKCDWVVSLEDGPLANTAHRGAVRELVAVAAIRARLRFRDGDSQGAISDTLTAMAAARHLSLDGSLASVLISYRLETEATAVLTQNLFRLSRDQLNQLERDIVALPSGSNLGAALQAEKVGRNDFVAIADRARTRDELIDAVAAGIPVLQRNRSVATEIVDGCGGSVSGFRNCIRQQESFYSSVVSEFALAPEQFEKAFKAQSDSLSKVNPLIQRFTPNLARFRWTEAYCQTRRALLLAAIAVRLEGPKALEKHLDPYDGTNFSYVPLVGGFRLKSHLTDSGVPLSIAILSNS